MVKSDGPLRVLRSVVGKSVEVVHPTIARFGGATELSTATIPPCSVADPPMKSRYTSEAAPLCVGAIFAANNTGFPAAGQSVRDAVSPGKFGSVVVPPT